MFGRKRKFKNVDVEITESEKEKLPKGFGYDPYPEWCEEVKRQNERKREDAEHRLESLLGEHKEAKRRLDRYDPKAEVRNYAAGDFLCFGEHEIPVAHIESIDVLEVGGEPRLDIHRGMPRECYLYATIDKGLDDFPLDFRRMPPTEWFRVIRYPALIGVRMASGRVETIECHRPQLEILKSRLEQAWKEGK